MGLNVERSVSLIMDGMCFLKQACLFVWQQQQQQQKTIREQIMLSPKRVFLCVGSKRLSQPVSLCKHYMVPVPEEFPGTFLFVFADL